MVIIDVCRRRRQIPKYENGPRAEKIKIFIMVVDTGKHRYLINDPERTIYDDLKLKKTFLVSIIQKYFS